jgi:MoaA/NifB/PqqE/SkfB family radical SAM enzyme
MTQWNSSSINLFMDISTYCNAGCPQCHRTESSGLGKVDWLPLVQWSLKQFKSVFTPEDLKNVNRLHFCGTFGDPMMVKDILKIVKYIMNNSNCGISFDTNGSMRNEDFWWDLGVTGGNRLMVRFDVDGINQKMHETYRRFTFLDKTLKHMDIMSQTNCGVEAQTILFKHNEEYKDEIRELCLQHGARAHNFVTSDRFSQGPTTSHIDEKGVEFTLEKATGAYETHRDKLETKLAKYKPRVTPVVPVTPVIAKEVKPSIKCLWAKPRNEVIISYDGQVLPCCYHQNNYHRKLQSLMKDDMYKDYEENKLKYNVFHTPLSEILNSEWYTKKLPNSINSDNPIRSCAVNCSKTGAATNRQSERVNKT